MNKYKVYHKAEYLGETMAISPQKAISNMRFKFNRRYAPMTEFKAKAV